ncbi:large ribosomal subunit protein mL43 [Trichomonascus vanleenenianus]|uniref:mitochondrial 54S ribosomal protein mL43 MRPL51 n=1 Tax=Trichomonascus vanleenenianus TaxID=2268995 RepID=UPI003ECA00B0
MVKPFAQQLPKTLNGVGSFIQPCKKITLRYCNWGGSSQGMRELLRKDIRSIAASHPKVEFHLARDPGKHPILKGEYTNGNTKVICVRNHDKQKVADKINLLAESSGARLKRYKKAVDSPNESVRGIWSPFHVDKRYRFRI